MESAKEKIGSPAQKLQLLCYAYDPSSGTYSLVVTNLLRIGGVVTLVLLGGFIILNIRREKKKALRAARI
jgi:protein SCO1/2